MLNPLIIFLCQLTLLLSKTFKLGSGSTWPGHIALKLNKNFIKSIVKVNPQLKIIIIAGTNGKTTTTKLIEFILLKNGYKVFRNAAGANLLNGIASTLIQHSSSTGKLNYDVALFEIDENTLPAILNELSNVNCKMSIILLNLFRDQLDRYGEINTIAKKWQDALLRLNLNLTEEQPEQGSTLFINGDDPQLTYISETSGLKSYYFGLDSSHMSKKDIPHDVDFLYCPKCQAKLIFTKMSYSHMGIFRCPKCHFKRKDIKKISVFYPLFGTYNIYNTHAAALLTHTLFNISYDSITSALSDFKPAFGRQEVLEYNGKKIIILLSKNPTGFNQSITAVNSVMGKHTILIVLNDKIPDGRDVSWIWDVEFEELVDKNDLIFLSGDRCYDIGIRILYASSSKNQKSNTKYQIEESLEKAINSACEATTNDQTLFILATYSAMLDVRQIITGRKLL